MPVSRRDCQQAARWMGLEFEDCSKGHSKCTSGNYYDEEGSPPICGYDGRDGNHAVRFFEKAYGTDPFGGKRESGWKGNELGWLAVCWDEQPPSPAPNGSNYTKTLEFYSPAFCTAMGDEYTANDVRARAFVGTTLAQPAPSPPHSPRHSHAGAPDLTHLACYPRTLHADLTSLASPRHDPRSAGPGAPRIMSANVGLISFRSGQASAAMIMTGKAIINSDAALGTWLTSIRKTRGSITASGGKNGLLKWREI